MRRAAVGRILGLVLVVAVGASLLWLRGKRGDKPATGALSFEAVERRTLVVSIEATGTVEPINLVEVKSKASGQIIRMPVEVGSRVKRGNLLVQIDTVDVQNQYRQARAALEAARVQAEVAAAQRARAEQLFASGILTAPEHESALLSDASAQSSLVRARTELENARLRREDATVRAPIDGTILAKPVAVGQVISSATSSVSGGTTLLQMADLRRIRVRALVPESDIGGVHEEMPAAISVDAYPNQLFEGRVEKVEPQAVVQQSVTMFPVLLSIQNEAGLLLPGMNGEVVVTTARAENVLAVPVDAVRGLREIASVALALGVTPDSLRAALRAEREGGGGNAAAGSADGGRNAPTGSADSARARGAWRRGGEAGGGRDSPGRAARRARGGSAAQNPEADGSGGAATSTRATGTRNAFFAVVKRDAGVRPRIVRLGVSNFDYAQVLGGLEEGDSVALLGPAVMQAERNESLARIRQRVGGGLPGTSGGASRTGAGSSRLRGGPGG